MASPCRSAASRNWSPLTCAKPRPWPRSRGRRGRSALLLGQRDDIAVRIAVSGGGAPGLRTRRMDDRRTGGGQAGVVGVQVVRRERHLRRAGDLTLRLVERKVQEGAVVPGQG